MIDPSEVTACIPTRGDVDMTEILASLDGFGEVIVWDNSQRYDYGVYGRYMAILRSRHRVVYVQDDDCLVDAARVCRNYQEGILVANMPAIRWSDYPDSALVGWGAVFDGYLATNAFTQYEAWRWRQERRPDDNEAVFRRTCDVIFSTLTPHLKIDVGFSHLPWAEGPGRMFTDDYPAHRKERDQMLELARKVRDA